MYFSKFALLLACGAAVWGQGFSAVWDENGNTLISTSLTPVGQTATGFPRLYQTSALGLQLVAAGAATIGIPDSIVSPRISARGETIAYSVSPFIPALHNPPPPPKYRGVARRGGVSYEYAGMAGLSADGRWAVFSPSNSGGVDGTMWRDLETGEEKFVAGLTAAMDSVADDGSVLSFAYNSVRIYRPDGTYRQWEMPFTPRAGVVSRDGSTALLLASDPPVASTKALYVMELASGVAHLLNEQCYNCRLLSISADGSQLLYSDGFAQATPHWVDWRSGQRRDLVTQAGQLASLQFSADGTAIYLANESAGSYRQDLTTGQESVLAAPIPELLTPPDLLATGGWYRIRGTNLRDVDLLVNGTVLPANSRDDTAQILQVPWYLPLGKGEWVVRGAKSLFEPRRLPVIALEQAPHFLQLVDLGETALDWQSVYLALSEADGALINRNRPAQPGEVIRLWLTGAGRTPEVLQWFGSQQGPWDRTTPMEVLGVEPYPRQEGWWVVRFRIPDGLAAGNFHLTCVTPVESPAGDFATLPVAVR
jgi:uncharacterized protein (TIGR03437 family)